VSRFGVNPTYLSDCLSICLSHWLSVHPWLGARLSSWLVLSIHLPTHLLICLPVYLSLYLSVCLSDRLSVHPWLGVLRYSWVVSLEHMKRPVVPTSVGLTCLSIYLTGYLSIYLAVGHANEAWLTTYG